MYGIIETIKAAPPEKLNAVKARLLDCCDKADKESGFFNACWRDAIEHMDTAPEHLLNCNEILHEVIAEALRA